MRTQTVVLAGQEFDIRELPLRKNAEWRKRVSDELSAAMGIIEGAEQLEITRDDAAAVFDLLREAKALVFSAPDTIVDLVYAYAPELRKAVDRDDVYESEIVDAFSACLRLAFPFGRVLDLLMVLMKDGSVQGQPEQT